MLPRFYRFLKKHLPSFIVAVLSFLFSTILSMPVGTSAGFFDNVRSSIASIFDYSTLAGLVCLILVGVLILVAAIYFVVKALLRRQTLSTDFHDVMLQNTAGTLREAVYPGSFSWGEEKPSNIARISSTGGSRKILF